MSKKKANPGKNQGSPIKFIAAGLVVVLGWFYGSKEVRDKMRPKAESPTDFSLKTWRDAFKETKNAFSNKSLPILAAGVAYFCTLAFFPLMAAAVAIAAFVISDSQLQGVVASLGQYLPADIAGLVSSQLKTLVTEDSNSIVIAAFSILLSLFSVSGAVQNLVSATNVAYSVTERRGFIKLRLLSLVMTVSAVALGFVVLALLIVNAGFLESFGVPALVADILVIARWPVLIGLMILILAVFYRYGPNRDNPDWQWVSWGAVIATAIWLLATILFFVYAQNFANFSETYSLFAGIIVLMIWLNVSALTVLLGAEVNHRLESKR